MAKRELGPAALAVAQAVADQLPDCEFVVGCSGGADSLALALGAAWVCDRRKLNFQAIVVDHGLQPGSDQIAANVVDILTNRGISARVIRVQVSGGGGLEAAARHARLTCLSSFSRPVLLGHTLDDQAETVLLGLVRGSGLRAVAGMAKKRGLFYRPLLGLRRSITQQACTEWGVTPWQDPHNNDVSFARVRVRTKVLPVLETQLGPGIAESLARTADLARADADLMDALSNASGEIETHPSALWLAGLDNAVRNRVLLEWLRSCGAHDLTANHLNSVSNLITHWRGQRGADVPGGRVSRKDGKLVFVSR